MTCFVLGVAVLDVLEYLKLICAAVLVHVAGCALVKRVRASSLQLLTEAYLSSERRGDAALAHRRAGSTTRAQQTAGERAVDAMRMTTRTCRLGRLRGRVRQAAGKAKTASAHSTQVCSECHLTCNTILTWTEELFQFPSYYFSLGVLLKMRTSILQIKCLLKYVSFFKVALW